MEKRAFILTVKWLLDIPDTDTAATDRLGRMYDKGYSLYSVCENCLAFERWS